MSRRFAAVIGVVIVTAVVVWWIGSTAARGVADTSRDGSIQPSAAAAAEQEARTFWDNPFQRILYVAISATGVQSGPSCPRYEVTAYALFGARMDRVFVDCQGVNRAP